MTLTRSSIKASRYAVSSGHRLASEAAIAVLEAGGNAVDAGVAGGIAGAATAVPFVASMLPSERAKAAGAPVEVDVSALASRAFSTTPN